jgi:ribulose-5-phosphate 4-epimerase/fuculose-1-phosphate aldolase
MGIFIDVSYRSVRDPILTDHFWLNPLSQHFSQISVSDLILVNEDGDVVIGDEPINAAAFAIHSESKKLSWIDIRGMRADVLDSP